MLSVNILISILILSSVKAFKRNKGVKVQPTEAPETAQVPPKTVEEEYEDLMAEIDEPRRIVRPKTGFRRTSADIDQLVQSIQVQEEAKIKMDKKLKIMSKLHKKCARFLEKTKSVASLFTNKTDQAVAEILAA